MSQFALLVITDENSIRQTCRGWVSAMDTPVTKNLTNPFTGEPIVVKSYVPPGVDAIVDCASLHEVHQAMKNAKPISIDFQWSSFFEKEFLHDAKPFLFGNDEEGVVSIKRISPDSEHRVVEYLGQQMGSYTNDTLRREHNLSMFVLVYDF